MLFHGKRGRITDVSGRSGLDLWDRSGHAVRHHGLAGSTRGYVSEICASLSGRVVDAGSPVAIVFTVGIGGDDVPFF